MTVSGMTIGSRISRLIFRIATMGFARESPQKSMTNDARMSIAATSGRKPGFSKLSIGPGRTP